MKRKIFSILVLSILFIQIAIINPQVNENILEVIDETEGIKYQELNEGNIKIIFDTGSSFKINENEFKNILPQSETNQPSYKFLKLESKFNSSFI